MTIRCRVSSRARVPAFVAACLLVVAACTGSATVTSAPPALPQTIPTAAPLAAGWYYRSWTDPDLEIGLPADWGTSCPTATSDPAALAGLPDAEKRYARWTDKLIAIGAIRLIGSGRVTCGEGWLEGGSARVAVMSGDASLGAFASRQIADLDGVFGVTMDRTVVTGPLGVAVRLAYRGWLSDEQAFVGREYLIMLPDGRSLDIAIYAPDAASDAAADEFAATVMSTLRPRH